MFLGFTLLIALVLMEANMFDFLNTLLGFYANCGMAWIVTVASDITFNKYLLKLSPLQPEFRRGMLYNGNPVGFGSMLVSAGVSILVFFGGGEGIQPYSPLVAIGLALVLPRCSPSPRGAATTCAGPTQPTGCAPTTASTCRCSTSTATPPTPSSPATSAGRTSSVPTWRPGRPTVCRSARCASADKVADHVLPAQPARR
jgi:hypothetical protein